MLPLPGVYQQHTAVPAGQEGGHTRGAGLLGGTALRAEKPDDQMQVQKNPMLINMAPVYKTLCGQHRAHLRSRAAPGRPFCVTGAVMFHAWDATLLKQPTPSTGATWKTEMDSAQYQ